MSKRAFLRSLFRRAEAAKYETVVAAEQSFYRRRLGSGMVAFDVGANKGEMALLFLQLVGPSGTVFAFEPGPSFAALVPLASEHPNLVIEHLALYESSTTVMLNVYEGDSWSTLADRTLLERGVPIRPTSRVSVQAVTLDHYCEERGVARIDLLKLDVEGAELQVLRGARRMFAEERVLSCAFEVGDTTFDMGNDPAEFLAFFEDVGFSVENMVAGDPLFPAGGHAFSMHHAYPRR